MPDSSQEQATPQTGTKDRFFQRGITIEYHTLVEVEDNFDPMLEYLRLIGGNHVTIAVKAWQPVEYSPHLEYNNWDIIGLTGVVNLMKTAGFSVTIKADVSYQQNESIYISHGDAEQYFSNYTEWILGIIEAGNRGNADVLSLGRGFGVETISAGSWLDFIDSLRNVCNSELTYCAQNIAEAKDLRMWKKFDFISISLPDNKPTDVEIEHDWHGIIDSIETLALEWQMPVLLNAVEWENLINPKMTTFQMLSSSKTNVVGYRVSDIDVIFQNIENKPWLRGVTFSYNEIRNDRRLESSLRNWYERFRINGINRMLNSKPSLSPVPGTE